MGGKGSGRRASSLVEKKRRSAISLGIRSRKFLQKFPDFPSEGSKEERIEWFDDFKTLTVTTLPE